MISYELDGNVLNFSFVDDNGKIDFHQHTIPNEEMYIWEKSRIKTNFKTHQGNYAKKTRTNKLNRFRIWEIIYGLDEKILKKISNPNSPEMWFMDIETEVINGFPDIENPKERVLTNSFCNGNKVYTTAIKNLTPMEKEWVQKQIDEHLKPIGKKYDFKFKYYESEVLMLKELFSRYIPSMTMVTGWNFLKFDWAYLTNRAKKLGLSPHIKNSSPTKTMENYYIKDKYRKGVSTKIQLPLHRIVLDYLTIYEKYDRSIKIKESSKLDWVAEASLGIKKVSYNGSLMELYEKDYKKYVFYNAVDTIINQEIHLKLDCFSTLNKLSLLTHTPLNQALFVSHCLESKFIESYMKRDRHVVNTRAVESSKYEGAYVKNPEPGIYDDVLVADFESLYPNIIMKYNICSYSYLGNIVDGKNKFIDRWGKEIYIDKNLHITTPSGAVFTNQERGVAPEIVNNMIQERIKAKTIANEIDTEINRLEKIYQSL